MSKQDFRDLAGSHNIVYTTFSNLASSQPYFLQFRQAGRGELLSVFILSAKRIPIEVQDRKVCLVSGKHFNFMQQSLYG